MIRKTRLWHREHDDDPLSGLVNLFDLWIVVVVALLLVLVRTSSVPSSSAPVQSAVAVTDPDVAVEEDEFVPIEKFRSSNGELTGKGTRLGTAYRLSTGEIVYTPD